MDDIMKIIKFLEEPDLLIKDVSETIKNETREKKGRFLGMSSGTLGASLLGNLSTDRGVRPKIPKKGVLRDGEGTIRAGEDTIRTDQNF